MPHHHRDIILEVYRNPRSWRVKLQFTAKVWVIMIDNPIVIQPFFPSIHRRRPDNAQPGRPGRHRRTLQTSIQHPQNRKERLRHIQRSRLRSAPNTSKQQYHTRARKQWLFQQSTKLRRSRARSFR